MSYCDNSHCVCNVVRKIAAAQDEVASQKCDCCTTGCDQSMKDLLSPCPCPSGQLNRFSTIPFLLYCKGNCSLFVATGITRDQTDAEAPYEAFVTPIFRVKKLSKKGGCCATIELLAIEDNGNGGNGDNGNDGEEGLFSLESANDIADLINSQNITNFTATGVCINVDLSDFSGIQCLNPINPLPANNNP